MVVHGHAYKNAYGCVYRDVYVMVYACDMHVCVCARSTQVRAWVWVHHKTCTSMHTRTCTCMHMRYESTYIYRMRMSMHTRTRTCVHMGCESTYMHVYVYVYACVHVYGYKHEYGHACVHYTCVCVRMCTAVCT